MKNKLFLLGLSVLAAGSARAQTATSTDTVTTTDTDTDTGTSTSSDAPPPPPQDPPKGNQAAIDTCKATFQTAMHSEPTQSNWGTHTAGSPEAAVAGALFHFHDAVWSFNVGDLADVEQIFCELTNAFEVGSSISTLPQTVSKTGPDGNTVALNLSAPTEAWATAAGYTVKASMSYNGTQFIAMWWTGSGETTKGYLVQGQNPMQSDGDTRLKYAEWDLTSASQVVKVYAAQYVTASGFLATAANGASVGGQVGVHYSRASYNTTTAAISGQVTRINPQQGTTTLGCAKDSFDGTVGGSISAYHVDNNPDPGYLAVTDSHKDNTSMTGIAGISDSTTVDGTNGTPGAAPTSVTFDYSCNDLDTSNAATGPFASGAVNYTADPSTIFPD